MKILKVALTVIVALFLGLIGLSLLFSDLGPGETMASRNATTIVYYFLSAFLIGIINPLQWLLAMFLTWGGFLLGFPGLFDARYRLEAAGFSLMTIVPVVSGGYLGSWVRRKRIIQKFFDKLRGRP